MPFNISEFKQQGLYGGGARSSLFQVEMTLPAPLQAFNTTLRKFSFTCRAASIPASTVGQVEVPYFGRKIKLAGDRTFADWSVTVMNDEDYAVRKMFETWSNLLNDNESNLKGVRFNGYKSGAIVKQFAKTNEIIGAYTFVGLFPTEISAMELDWETTNSIQTFSVSLAYDYWLPTNLAFSNLGIPPS